MNRKRYSQQEFMKEKLLVKIYNLKSTNIINQETLYC